jgi:alpha-ribazole phosphatase
VAAAQGRCIGRSDLRPDPRRVRRLARRIRSTARAAGLPRYVQVSPLARCREVGRALRQLGFECRVVPDLIEADFGRWDVHRWADLPPAEDEAWASDLVHHAPGGGESVAALARRAGAWLAAQQGRCLVVGHAGWVTALRWTPPPGPAAAAAAAWPAPPRHGVLVRLGRGDDGRLRTIGR